MREHISIIPAQYAMHAALCMSALFVLLLFGGILLCTYNPLSLDDGLRHFVMAKEQMRYGIGTVTWTQYFFSGYFVRHSIDPWFLANLSYAPFTFFADSVAGIKAATFAFLCTLLFSLLIFFRHFRTSPFFAALTLLIFFLGSDTFGFRLMLGRPYVLISALMLFVLYALITRRWIMLSIFLAISALFSHLFIFPFGVGVVGSLWWFFVRRSKSDAFVSSIATIGGTLTGMLLHPQSGEYFLWMKNIFFVVPFSKELDLGGEVYSGLGFTDVGVYLLLISCILLCFLLASRGELSLAMRNRPEIILLGALTLLFFIAYLQWVRAIDLFWPIGTLLFLSLVSVSEEVERDALRFFRSKIFPFRLSAMHIVFVLFLMTSVHHVWLFVGDDARRSPASFDAIESVPAGSTVFNVDWEFFSVLFFLRSDLLYARGMDPTHDDLSVRALIAKLSDRRFLSQEPMFSHAWFADLWSRIDWKELGIRRTQESEIDVDAWLAELRTIADPAYLAMRRDTYPMLTESLKNRNDLTVFSESRAMIIFSLKDPVGSAVR